MAYKYLTIVLSLIFLSIGAKAQPETFTQYIMPDAVVDTVQLYQDLLRAVKDDLRQDDGKALRVRILVFDNAYGEWKRGEIITLEAAWFWTSRQQRLKEIDAFLERLIDALNTVFGSNLAQHKPQRHH